MEDGTGAIGAPIKRMVAAACALALALGLAGCTLTTPTRDEVEEEAVEAALESPSIVEDGVLTVALDTSDAPQSLTTSDGSLTGYAIDVALALGERLGLDVKVVDAVSASGLADLEADIFIGTSSDDVPDGCESTDVYLEDATAIFTNTSSIAVSSVSVSAMETAVVGVQDASASQDALTDAGILATQQTYENVNECFEALEAGEVDYVACEATSGAYLARMYDDISFVGSISATSSYTIVMSAENEELVSAVVDALEDIEADGTLLALHTAWYGDLPSDLVGQQITGVTVEGEEAEESDSEESVSESDEELMVTDDINSLSD